MLKELLFVNHSPVILIPGYIEKISHTCYQGERSHWDI